MSRWIAYACYWGAASCVLAGLHAWARGRRKPTPVPPRLIPFVPETNPHPLAHREPHPMWHVPLAPGHDAEAWAALDWLTRGQ